MKEKDLPLLDHLKELRVRLLRSFIGVIVIFLPLIFFSNAIYELASSPLQALMPENSSMIATQVASPFLSPLKLTFYLSLMISLPYFFSEMWRFIAPGLYKNEKRFALGLTLSSILLFYLGILFAYFLVFPLVFGSLFEDLSCFFQLFSALVFYQLFHSFWIGFREGRPCFFANSPAIIAVF